MPSVTRTDDMEMLLQVAAGDIRQLTDKTASSYARAESCRPAGIYNLAAIAAGPWGPSRSHRVHAAHRPRPGNSHTVATQRGHRPPACLERIGLSAATATRAVLLLLNQLVPTALFRSPGSGTRL